MTETAQEVLVARQPICAVNGKTLGYELLFRKSYADHANVENADLSTAEVIVNSFMDIGLDRIVGRDLAFINVSRDFVLANHCRSLPPGRIVYEILENTVPDAALLDELSSLRGAGYRFALDDYDFKEQAQPLLPFCDYVKIDLRLVAHDGLAERMRGMAKTKLLAEKVETRQEYDFCKKLGFHYFQGYYFCKPDILSGAKIPVNRVSIMRLLAKLCDPEVNMKELSAIVGEDLSLSYKLLRYLNSAYVGLKKQVESIGHAVRMVGTDNIRLLATLIMLTSMDDKPRELTVVSLIRAKMCELLALRLGIRNKEAFFTVGLFSTLDAFLDCAMADALDKLPLSEEIRKALLDRAGVLGEVLDSVLAYERAGMNGQKIKLDAQSFRAAYAESVYWGENLITGLS